MRALGMFAAVWRIAFERLDVELAVRSVSFSRLHTDPAGKFAGHAIGMRTLSQKREGAFSNRPPGYRSGLAGPY